MLGALAIGMLTMMCEASLAANYVFLSAPEIDLNRVYRRSATGKAGACQYGLKEGTVGVTLCYPPGDGAGPQPPSDYALIASHHEHEGGVFRVDVRNGTDVDLLRPQRGRRLHAAGALRAQPKVRKSAPFYSA